MINRTALEITPLDFRRIRQGLGFSQKRMGESIATYTHGPGSCPIPASRINEWEMHVRAVPDHVYISCARILLDIWVKVRDGKSEDDARYLDPKFAAFLSPALALSIGLEAELRDRNDDEGLRLHAKALQIRKEFQSHLESLFMIDLANILS